MARTVGCAVGRSVGCTTGVGEAVDRITAHLRKNYGYTLDLRRDDRYAPLEDFLFVQRRGHCEYFSTAMVILLRTLGIGARSVNGFMGGTWNDYGGYLAVSQGDRLAAWVVVASALADAYDTHLLRCTPVADRPLLARLPAVATPTSARSPPGHARASSAQAASKAACPPASRRRSPGCAPSATRRSRSTSTSTR